MKIPKSFLKAVIALCLSFVFYISGSLKVYEQREEKKNQENQLAAMSRELSETREISLNHAKLKNRFLKARELGLLQKGNRQKLMDVLENLFPESALDHLSCEAGLSEKKTFAGFPCRWTRITLHMEHFQDVDIFRFIDTLPQKLPGALIPEHLSLIRHETTGVSGSYHFYLLTLENTPQ